MKYFLKCLYCSSNGRARRKEFWFFVLYSSIFLVLWHLIWMGIAYCFDNFLEDPDSRANDGLFTLLIFGYVSIFLLLFPPFVAVIARRLHDIGISLNGFLGISFLLYIVLYILYKIIDAIFIFNIEDPGVKLFGICFKIMLVVLCCFMLIKGNKDGNPYGSDPRQYDPIEMAGNIKKFREVAERGDSEAQCNLGVCYSYGLGVSQDLEEAIQWFRKSAEQGCAQAQCNLGFFYEEGLSVSKDLEEAAEWYQKAAIQGYSPAQYNLGNLYAEGYGVSRDYDEAVEWFRKAAEQGDVSAILKLGVCYSKGLGVSEDLEKAAECFTTAANLGCVAAQFNLGLCYAKGLGISKDLSKAVKWFKFAESLGDAEAKKLLDKCSDGDGGYDCEKLEIVLGHYSIRES